MPLATLGYALNRLRVPDKIVHLLLMTYRYVFVLEQEYQRLMRAVKIRGFQPATNLHTYRTYAYVVGMLFVRAAERAERVQQAMLCRGFKRKFYCLQEFKADRGGHLLRRGHGGRRGDHGKPRARLEMIDDAASAKQLNTETLNTAS